ncbi:hypothetical protein HRH25_14425 [Flavisolibacter sp. BT320]|nr:hypothetical protein [Flavisolibacter longurius]
MISERIPFLGGLGNTLGLGKRKALETSRKTKWLWTEKNMTPRNVFYAYVGLPVLAIKSNTIFKLVNLCLIIYTTSVASIKIIIQFSFAANVSGLGAIPEVRDPPAH